MVDGCLEEAERGRGGRGRRGVFGCAAGEAELGDEADIACRRVVDKVADVGIRVVAARARSRVHGVASRLSVHEAGAGCGRGGGARPGAGVEGKAWDRQEACRSSAEPPAHDAEAVPGHEGEDKPQGGDRPEGARGVDGDASPGTCGRLRGVVGDENGGTRHVGSLNTTNESVTSVTKLVGWFRDG